MLIIIIIFDYLLIVLRKQKTSIKNIYINKFPLAFIIVVIMIIVVIVISVVVVIVVVFTGADIFHI